MRVRIVSDGTPPGTHITDVDTGRDVSAHVTDLTLWLNVKHGDATVRLIGFAEDDKGRIFPDLRERVDQAEVVSLDMQGQVSA